MVKKILLITALVIYSTSILYADIVTVKQDGTGNYTTIQEGINAILNAYDTVLVWPGVYYENIVCNDIHITVSSLYLTNPDEWYIQNTIIDGNHNGTCVTMNGEPSLKVLHGFTIQNGLGNNAGGIYINDVAGVVESCIIKQNTGHVGGISIKYGSGIITNCIIENNTGYVGGGGIMIQHSPLSISGTTIKYNHAYGPGGGIYRGINSSVNFDPYNKCNLYLNYGSPGTDFYKSFGESSQLIIVDTFTVSNPDHYYIGSYDDYGNPTYNVNIQLDHSYLELVNHDLYINPVSGDDNNSGLSIDDPLKTIGYAFIIITADSADPRNIYLSNGLYSPFTNSEKLPFGTKSYVSLIGESTDSTIIDADSLSHFIAGFGMKKKISIKNITFQNCRNGIFIRQTDSVVISDVVLKNGGNFVNFELGNIQSLVIRNTQVKNFQGVYALSISNWGEQTNFFSIENCIIEHNSPGSIPAWQGREGGGIEIRGSWSDTTFRSYGRIINTQITNNTRMPDPEVSDGKAAGLYVNGAVKLDLINATIGNNTLIATNGTGVSSAVYAELNVYNSILFDNYPNELAIGYENSNTPAAICRVYNSNLGGGESEVVLWQPTATLVWGLGNIDSDPMWDTTAVTPYAIPLNSPCVNSGTPIYETGMEPPYIILEDTIYKLITFDYDTILLPQTDLAGNPRISNGRIDMGAIESPDFATKIEEFDIWNSEIEVGVYPNPFFASTVVSFYLAGKAQVRVIIYDLMGNEVRRLEDATILSGKYALVWKGDDNNGQILSNGIYMVTMLVNGKHIAAEKVVKKGK